MLKPRSSKHNSSRLLSSKRDRTEMPSKPINAPHKKRRMDPPPRSKDMGTSHSFGKHRGTPSPTKPRGSTPKSSKALFAPRVGKEVTSYFRPCSGRFFQVEGELVKEANWLHLGKLFKVTRDLEKSQSDSRRRGEGLGQGKGDASE